MYEGVSVEKLLEIHGVISVSVLEGLSFAPNIGAEAWGVPIHFLSQACIKTAQNHEMIGVRMRRYKGVKGVQEIKLACQVLLGVFNLARGIDAENGNGVRDDSYGDLTNPGGMRKKSVMKGRKKGETINPTPWCLPSGVLEWRISHPDL